MANIEKYIFGVTLWTPRENFDLVRKALKEQIALVPARAVHPLNRTTSGNRGGSDDSHLRNILVYEKDGSGVYRISCHAGTQERPSGSPDNQSKDYIHFKYWFPIPEGERGSMEKALRIAYALVRPTRITDGIGQDVQEEQFLRDIQD